MELRIGVFRTCRSDAGTRGPGQVSLWLQTKALPSSRASAAYASRLQACALGILPPVAEWESSASPPLQCISMLADIMHCPGKKGTDVSQVLEKQLGRIGLTCHDVVSGTRGGGGENEGQSGIHSHFENLSPGYVRRRCLPHLAWRTADQAIRGLWTGLQGPMLLFM